MNNHMLDVDVFNGDADGICSLVQLRLAEPRNNRLVTGIKRDIHLLKNVKAAAGQHVTVLDISLEKNRQDVVRLLNDDVSMLYIDHHQAGEIPDHPNLHTYIDRKPSVCTAIIVNDYLRGRFALWAIVAAFGDNLKQTALRLAQQFELSETTIQLLQQLGVYLNYNSYGAALQDLFYHPADLYQACVGFSSPIDFIHHHAMVFETLEEGYLSDMAMAQKVKPCHQTQLIAAVILPDKAWAQRVNGALANSLSIDHPHRAHTILIPKAGGYQVSIRAPQTNLYGADEIASHFPTGGGRKGAAGIHFLPETSLSQLIDLMTKYYK